jgi:succinate dehydrogenase / fumarate reductase membrane anchor subunit
MNSKTKSLRTPLGRVRGLGAAKEGVQHWWAQRLTALAIIPLGLWFVGGVLAHLGADQASVQAWLAGPCTGTLAILLLVALFYHASLGLQVVVEDYCHTEWLKIASLVVIKFAAFFLATLSIISVLKMMFGG